MSDENYRGENREDNELGTNHRGKEQQEQTTQTEVSGMSSSQSEGSTHDAQSQNDVNDPEQKYKDHENNHQVISECVSVQETVSKIKQLKFENADSEEASEYLTAVDHASRHHVEPNHAHVCPFDRDDAFWRQALEHQGEEIRAAKPKVGSKNAGKLSGEAALMRIRAAVSLGTIVSIPLWHTGIWVKIKAPSEGTLLELERRIFNEKITLGRKTIGAAFTNTSVYVNGQLVDCILNHIYDTTYHSLDPQTLKKAIKVTDIPQLVWGMVCAIYPDGYRLVRPCVSNPSKCNHKDEGHVNLSKLSWVDNRAFSQYQRNFMSDRDADVDDKDLERYQQDFKVAQHKHVKVTDDLTVRLEVPSIEEYEQAGYKWVDSIVKMTDEAFGQQLRGNQRDNYIVEYATMTNLRRYSHWIKRFDFSDGDYAIDRETIDQSLDALTGADKERKSIVDSVEQFIKESVICAIGIPRYTCPACGGEPAKEDLAHNLSEIIQLEVNELFFTLLYLRVTRIMNES